MIGYRNLVIITVLSYHWGLLSFSEGHLQGYSFLWLFGRVEPLLNSSGSSPLSRSTYREWRVEFRERSGSIRAGRVRWAHCNLQLRLEPAPGVGGQEVGGSTTCGAVGTVEESGRLIGLGLVSPVGLPVAAVLLAGGIIIQYGGGGSSSPSGSCKITSSSLVTFWAIRIFPSPP